MVTFDITLLLTKALMFLFLCLACSFDGLFLIVSMSVSTVFVAPFLHSILSPSLFIPLTCFEARDGLVWRILKVPIFLVNTDRTETTTQHSKLFH